MVIVIFGTEEQSRGLHMQLVSCPIPTFREAFLSVVICQRTVAIVCWNVIGRWCRGQCVREMDAGSSSCCKLRLSGWRAGVARWSLTSGRTPFLKTVGFPAQIQFFLCVSYKKHTFSISESLTWGNVCVELSLTLMEMSNNQSEN